MQQLKGLVTRSPESGKQSGGRWRRKKGEGSGCRHYDVTGSRLTCSEKGSADSEKKGDGSKVHQAHRTKERPLRPKVLLAYKFWVMKD